MSEKIEGTTTPVGEVAFSFLNKADDYGNYSIGLIFSLEDGEKLRDILEPKVDEAVEIIKEQAKERKIKPAKLKSLKRADVSCKHPETEEGEEIEDKLMFVFKCPAFNRDGEPNQKPPIYDSQKNKLDPAPMIWGGSKLRASLYVYPYYRATDNTAGLAVRFGALQIFELRNSSTRTAESFGFDEMEGGYTYEPAGGDQDFESAAGGGDSEEGDF